jgi:O-antigen ligase
LFNGGLAEALRSVFSLNPLIVYLWMADLFYRRGHVLTACLSAVLPIAALGGLFGTIQQIFDFHPFGYRYLQGTGFLSSPMAFAGQMQIFSLLSLGLLLKGTYKQFPRPLNRTWVFAVVTGLNLLGVFFAGERSAWLGAAAGAFVLAGCFSLRAALGCLASLAVVAVVSFYTVPIVHTRFEPLLSGKQDVGTRVRLDLWRTALDCWRQSPIVGIGIRRFPHQIVPEAIVPGRSKDLNHAHSNYLQILSTTGLFGCAAYAWILISVIAACLRNMKRTEGAAGLDPYGLAVGILAGTASLMVAGIFEYNFGTSQVRLAQWFVLAMLSYRRLPSGIEHQDCP